MSDKRSVSTDALETLGTAPISDDSGRDAIHLAVEPVIAAERLKPGQDVGLLGGGKAGRSTNPVGIVDPFLKKTIKPGEKFWLVVYPRQITSLRHVWTHPSFEEVPISEADKEQAQKVAERLTGSHEKWLRDFCANADCPGYEEVMEAAAHSDGEYIHFGTDAHGEIPDEFWDHYEIVTGKKVKQRATYFSCSC
jgi:hypothetical protein